MLGIGLGTIIPDTDYTDGSGTYYCKSRDLAFNCDRISGTRCYTGKSYKVCSEGWNRLELGSMVVHKDGRDWKCNGTNSESLCMFGSRTAKYGELK